MKKIFKNPEIKFEDLNKTDILTGSKPVDYSYWVNPGSDEDYKG